MFWLKSCCRFPAASCCTCTCDAIGEMRRSCSTRVSAGSGRATMPPRPPLKLTRLLIRPVIATLFILTGWAYTLRILFASTRLIVVL